MTFFTELLILVILKFIWEHKKTLNSQSKLKKKKIEEQSCRYHTPCFQGCMYVYYKATLIKIEWYWHKKQTRRSLEQNREFRYKPTLLSSIYLQQ